MNKKSFLWNMLGSGIYAAATILFVMIAKRCAGEEMGASFYMAFTTGQMLLTIGYFEMRPFQSTDVGFQFTEGDYFGFRTLSSATMLLACIPVLIVYGVGRGTGACGLLLILIMTAYKMMDAVSDVFEGEFQRRERMDLAGKSMFIRVCAGLVVFTLVAYISRNILLSAFGMLLAAILSWFLTDLPWMKKMGNIRPTFSKERLLRLFRSTVLLFLGSMMCNWIWNGTKYIVEWNYNAETTLIYGIIFMPVMVINLGSGFLFKPMLTTMARQYEEKKYSSFVKTIGILLGGVASITILCIGGAYLLGVPVLGAVYAVDLSAYRKEMLLLLAGGGLNAMGIIFYYCLTVMRRVRWIFAGYSMALLVSFILPLLMSKYYGIRGICYSYIMVMGILLVIHAIMTVLCILREQRGNRENESK